MHVIWTIVLVCIFLVNNSFCEENLCLENHSVFYGVSRAAVSVLKDSECKNQLIKLSSAFEDNEIWAVKLYDASGSPSTGLHWGNTFWLGSRVQCLGASNSKKEYASLDLKPDYRIMDDLSIPPFGVDYFMAYIFHQSEFQIPVKYDNETKIALGLCLPSACEPGDIHQVLQEYLTSSQFKFKLIYNTSLEVVEVKRTTERFDLEDPLAFLLIVVLLVLGLLVIGGTVYDLQITKAQYNQEKPAEEHSDTKETTASHNDGIFSKILLSFSFVRHYNNVFSMTDPKNKLKAITGIRVQATYTVILAHGCVYLVEFVNNRTVGFLFYDKLENQAHRNNSFSTDSFLCLSGFLLVYSFYNSKKEDSDTFCSVMVSCFKDIFKRFMRISPTYFLVMLISIVLATWTHRFDSLWFNEREDLICRETWWTNLLYVNNILPGENICMYWSHYLSLDMQFFVITTIILRVSRRHLSTPVIPLTAVLLASMSCLGYVTYITNYKPMTVNFFNTIGVFYYPPWMRAGPYMIGALFGYAYHKFNQQLVLNKAWIALIWTTMFSLMLFIIFGFSDRDLSMPWAIFHTSFSRNIWALCVGWMILACITNNGGILNSFFSAKIWLPLSKLTYSAYLLNPIIIHTMASFSEQSYSFETVNMAITSHGIVFVSFLLAVPFTCCVELPCIQLYNVLADRFSQSNTDDISKTHKKNKN